MGVSVPSSEVHAEDQRWMQLAIEQACKARDNDEVPVGAVVVRNGQLIGSGSNQVISRSDPSAHAEVVALRAAALDAANYRLPHSTLYVTLEPCAMCVGTLVHARVARVVFGATEPKAGCLVSNSSLIESGHFNHRFEFEGGVLGDECSLMLSEFFASRRK